MLISHLKNKSTLKPVPKLIPTSRVSNLVQVTIFLNNYTDLYETKIILLV